MIGWRFMAPSGCWRLAVRLVADSKSSDIIHVALIAGEVNQLIRVEHRLELSINAHDLPNCSLHVLRNRQKRALVFQGTNSVLDSVNVLLSLATRSVPGAGAIAFSLISG